MQISLKERKLSNGTISLYIEYYRGSIIENDGKRNHLRDYENLQIYLVTNPSTAAERKKNKEQLQLANDILAIRKSEILQGKFKIADKSRGKRRFLEYFQEKTDERVNNVKNHGVWTSALHHMKICVPKNLTFEDVTDDFIKSVRKYFEKDARTKSNLALSQNSKYAYFNKFRACLRTAYEEGLTSLNYAIKVKTFEQAESQREYLTFKELQALINTPCKYEILKRAFIFSCLTGLRWSDINKMIWSEVRDEGNEVHRVNFRQEKTLAVEYLYISKQARELLGERNNPTHRVFKGLKYGAVYNSEIVRWCNRAGVFKHITFHSARHTNAVLLLENGADLFTVQKRLGHKEIKTTAIYAKIVDEKMRQSANIIPAFDLS